MTAKELQDSLLRDKELEILVLRDALYNLKLWFRDEKERPHYGRILHKLLNKYEEKETEMLMQKNLIGGQDNELD
jgi:hypothetical protein|tara:strand:- start:856 stop:1080 length:225 start_codon:yes stop_codon:yes gene_type:complete